MRSPRPAALAAALTLALALGACGDDDNNGGDEPAQTNTSERTTTTTEAQTQPDPAVKSQLQAAIVDYNRGFSRFSASLRDIRGDLDRLKSFLSDYRDVFFEFDKELRAIEFPDDLVPQVNSILEDNRKLIADLDEMTQAETFDAAIDIYGDFGKQREATVNKINNLRQQV